MAKIVDRTEKRRYNKKVDAVDLVDRERIQYNKEHGTNYSYGYFVAYKRLGCLEMFDKTPLKEILAEIKEYNETHGTNLNYMDYMNMRAGRLSVATKGE